MTHRDAASLARDANRASPRTSAVRPLVVPEASAPSHRRAPTEVQTGTTGRGLDALPQPAAQPPSRSDGEPLSPFVAFAPDASKMQLEAERRREDSLGVFAIVGGLLFMLGSAVVVTFAALVIGGFVYLSSGDTLVASDGDDPGHIIDTGRAQVGPSKPGFRGGGGAVPDAEDPLATGPGPGPATIIIPGDALFHSVEVNCPAGFRGRGRFRNGKAVVHNVPAEEQCTVHFQGSKPAKTQISGHETKVCTQFDPTTVCRNR